MRHLLEVVVVLVTTIGGALVGGLAGVFVGVYLEKGAKSDDSVSMSFTTLVASTSGAFLGSLAGICVGAALL